MLQMWRGVYRLHVYRAKQAKQQASESELAEKGSHKCFRLSEILICIVRVP